MKDIFNDRDTHYNLKSKSNCQFPNAKTTSNRIENIQYVGRHLWLRNWDVSKFFL